MTQLRTYPYKHKLHLLLLCKLFVGAALAFMVYEAMNNDAGLIINGVIKLDVAQATGFYWVMAGLCAIGFIFCDIALVQHFTKKLEVMIDEHAISAPKNALATQNTVVPFGNIQRLSMKSVSGQHILLIEHQAGKMQILSSMLPSQEAFDEICEIISNKYRKR